CMPLMLRGEPLGALYLGDNRRDFVTEQQRQFLESFAYFASTAIENAQLYQAISDKKQELETILSGIGDGVLVVDGDLRVVLMNPVATRIFNLPAPPPDGAPLPERLRQEPIYELLNEIRESPDGSRMQEIELAPRGSDQLRTYQALATPLVVGNALQGIATVLRDITTQKELERMKSNFLSVVSHELRTPLHAIKGFVNIILMGKTGPVTEIQRDFLETVQEQTNNLQRLIDDLLEFSRLESGRVTLRLQPVDIPVVIEAVVEKLILSAQSAGVSLVNHTPEDIPTIMADPWRLEQVVTNLVDNAIKFTPAGGSVTVAAEDVGDYIQVSVSDTGIGIPHEQQERIFDRFYQVDSGANRQYKGTGLGLTICRHIVEHHRGRIWVESEPGQGATFYFTVYKHLEEEDIGSLDFTTLPQKESAGK
ncbi:MAG TPA: sensor histidine kinase, partial [Anaerolineae bacterium]|nr:sensor histidine kinase [Anaerolineae bacterium]